MTSYIPSVPKTELGADDIFRKKWKEVRQQVVDIRKLFHTFSHAYDPEVIDGNKKKGIPPRPDLQMQRRLYRAESVRLTNLQYTMLQQAYEKVGDRKRLRTELLD